LLVMAIVTLLQELFSGRAMRPAAGARFERIEQVAMPVAHEPPNHEPSDHEPPDHEPPNQEPADIEDLGDRTAEVQAEPPAAAAAPATGPATGDDVGPARRSLGEIE
ncbi:MAG: chain-length determining protein, partial [Mesorhizobium sp.]